MGLILSERDNIQSFINKNFQRHWEKTLVDVAKRVRVVDDLEKWKPDIIDIWQQKKTNKREYSIYFDNEFVCRCSSNTSPWQLEVDFLKGVLELFEHNKIYFDIKQYQEEGELIQQIKHDKKEEKKLEEQKIDKLNADPIVKASLKELNEEDYQHTVISPGEIDRAREKL